MPSLHIYLKHDFRAIGVPDSSGQSRVSLVKYKFNFFTRRRVRRRRRLCLSSLISRDNKIKLTCLGHKLLVSSVSWLVFFQF